MRQGKDGSGMNLKPLGDRIIVKQQEADEKTAGGLIIAPKAQEKPQRGIIIAVGEGKLDNNGNLVKPGVKEGDSVIYSSTAEPISRLAKRITSSSAPMTSLPFTPIRTA